MKVIPEHAARLLLVLLLAWNACSQAPPTPGIRAALSQNAVERMKEIVVADLLPILNNISIPYFYVDADSITLNM